MQHAHRSQTDRPTDGEGVEYRCTDMVSVLYMPHGYTISESDIALPVPSVYAVTVLCMYYSVCIPYI